MSVRAALLRTGLAVALAVVAVPAAGQESKDAPLKKLTNPEPQPRRGFNVVLLLGDMQDPSGQDTVPNAARKALADMKDFLPYKGYRLLDTQWVLASTSGPAITRLRGVDEQDYELELRGSAILTTAATVTPGATFVRFVLRDGSEPAGGATKGDGDRDAIAQREAYMAQMGREIYQLERERDELTVVVENSRRKVETGVQDPAELKQLQVRLSSINKRITDLKQSAAPTSVKTGRAVIDTSFRMEDGETVVVGTSKVKGGKALIALLTATAERPKSSTK